MLARLGIRPVVLLAVALAACASKNVPAPVDAEREALVAGFLAKGLCSGLWVNGRERDDFLARDVLLGGDALPRITLDVDAAAHTVTARTTAAGTRTAVFHATHGCTLLPDGATDVSFDSAPIPRAAGRDELLWPLGEAVLDELPADIDAQALHAAVDSAFVEDAVLPIHTRAFLVVHRGRLVAERYAEGFDADSVMIGWSMGKSVTAALVGVAVRKGWLDPQQPAPIAEWQQPGDARAEIRIRHLLQMSSGLDCARIEPTQPGFFSAANRHFYVYFAPVDVFAWGSDRPLDQTPGSVGRYRNCDPLTLGRILRETVEARGESYLTFPQRELFDPIGARSMVLERDYRGNMILTGYDHGTPRDWARFGLLHLRDGTWMGRRILPESWVELISSPGPAWTRGNYGGQFWINGDGSLPGAPSAAYYAAGAFGQYVVLLPDEELVVVRMGYSANSGAVRASLGKAIHALIEALQPLGLAAGSSPGSWERGHE